MSDRILIATYDCEKSLLAGTRAVRAEGIDILDVYTPYPVHGLDKAMGLAPSRLTWACGAFGLTAAIFMTWFQYWTSAVSWPINIGGKPWDSLPAFAPVIFESMVLCAGLGSVAALFLVARLWPGRKTRRIVDGVTNDRFALVIEHADAKLDLEEMRQLLAPSNPIGFEERAEHASERRSVGTSDSIQDPPWLGPVNAGLLVVLLLLAAVCIFAPRNLSRPNWEIFPEMMRSPAYSAISENPNFPDRMTNREPVVGAIARDLMPIHYQATDEDALAAGNELTNPFAAEDPGVLDRGQYVFEAFCVNCHGGTGAGDGPVAMRGFPPPPSFATGKSLEMEDGQLYHMLTYGKGNMPAHAGQVAREDRWKAILHVRRLQEEAVAAVAAAEAAAVADAENAEAATEADTPEAVTPGQAEPTPEAPGGAES